ncbi:hypothetical protein RYX36_009458, partial [Vicia faba]
RRRTTPWQKRKSVTKVPTFLHQWRKPQSKPVVCLKSKEDGKRYEETEDKNNDDDTSDISIFVEKGQLNFTLSPYKTCVFVVY